MNYLTTREIQAVLLGMLSGFDAMASERGIRYSLDGGTLLGAVRHKGFIPWDDDIDVIVPRPDFDLLAAHPEWAPLGLSLDISGRGGYLYPFIKLVNPLWRAQEPHFEGVFDEFLWVDIFPADAMPNDKGALAKLMARQRHTWRRAVRSYVSVDGSTPNPLKRAIKKIVYSVHRTLFPAREQFSELGDRAASLDYRTAFHVGNVVWGPYKPDKPGFPVEDFDNLIDMEFEGRTFKACPHWDAYLRGLYGDYMQLPPEDQRVTHGMRVWKAGTEEEG